MAESSTDESHCRADRGRVGAGIQAVIRVQLCNATLVIFKHYQIDGESANGVGSHNDVCRVNLNEMRRTLVYALRSVGRGGLRRAINRSRANAAQHCNATKININVGRPQLIAMVANRCRISSEMLNHFRGRKADQEQNEMRINGDYPHCGRHCSLNVSSSRPAGHTIIVGASV